MKKVKFRANAAILIACLMVLGLCLYLVRLADDGQNWALFRGNLGLYSSGILDTGTLVDRNGTVLASAGGGSYSYAGSETVRRACLHTVGDYPGNIGTGALNAFASKLAGYSFVEGIYSRDGKGAVLELTIDADLCAAAYSALNGRHGTVLICDYLTGELLCMVSSPGFDPANPPSDMSGDAYCGWFINRWFSSTFTPGSVFKIVTLAAAIEEISDLYTRVFNCSGSTTADGKLIRCSGTHGTQDIAQAFANSCNVAFAELSIELGAEQLISRATELGLCTEHELSGIPTAAGSVAAAADNAELAWLGIGQADDLVSPYALLRLCAAIANGGLLTEPYLCTNPAPSLSNKTRLLREDTANKLAQLMRNNAQTTYTSLGLQHLDVGAKTGTAEVGDSAHSWFAGFLSDSERHWAFVVLIENGGSGLTGAGSTAARIIAE